VAALNILIALTMMVMEKTRDIAVMMSFGVTGGPGAEDFSAAGAADLARLGRCWG
jgi:lipoprotein-releasing system permease protein